MPFVNPETVSNPTTAQPILASWGDAVDTALGYLAQDFPHCSIKESTAQSVPNNTYTALTSDEENSDIGGMHSTVTNTSRITIPAGEGGLYVVTLAVAFAANATGERFVGIGLNGSSPTFPLVGVNNAGGSSSTVLSGATSKVFAAGDYVECMVLQNSGGALNVQLYDFSVAWRAVV